MHYRKFLLIVPKSIKASACTMSLEILSTKSFIQLLVLPAPDDSGVATPFDEWFHGQLWQATGIMNFV
jgi:hypothetical protein